jgi:hypothetical protein
MNTPKALLPRTHALLLILTLAACGGGAAPKPGPGGPAAPPPPASFDTLETAYIGANARLAARSNTAFIPPLIEGMPTTGGATYTGVMFVELDTAGMTTQLYGNADVTANFDASSMSGSVTDFYGRDRTGSQAAYTGAVSLTNGTIGAARPNAFDLDFSGALSGNGESISLSGTMDGDFKGDPIRGILGVDTTPTANIDANPFTGRVLLAAEVDP